MTAVFYAESRYRWASKYDATECIEMFQQHQVPILTYGPSNAGDLWVFNDSENKRG